MWRVSPRAPTSWASWPGPRGWTDSSNTWTSSRKGSRGRRTKLNDLSVVILTEYDMRRWSLAIYYMYCRIISYHVISYHITSYHIISHHLPTYHIISRHITSYHVTSCHIVFPIFRTGKCFNVDIFGQGPHTGPIKDFAKEHQLPVRMKIKKKLTMNMIVDRQRNGVSSRVE